MQKNCSKMEREREIETETKMDKMDEGCILQEKSLFIVVRKQIFYSPYNHIKENCNLKKM